MMINDGETNSVLKNLLSDCCGNIQNVVDNACIKRDNEYPSPILAEEDAAKPPSNSNLKEYYTHVDDFDDFRSNLIHLLGTEFIYDLSPYSIPYIHPAEEAEIIEAATLANRKDIYYSCYLPSTHEKAKVRSIMGEWNLLVDAKNANGVEIAGRTPRGSKMV